MLVLSGVLVVIVGFAVGLNPLLVVTVAGFVTGIAAGIHPLAVLADFGHAFITSRYVAIVWLVVPVIGLLERVGLRERAQTLIANFHTATVGRLLLVYLLFRQITAALIRANAAAADNIGAFFGEDIFVAMGSILLIRGVLQLNGINVQPISLAVWAIPTAVLTFLIHGARLLLLDRRLQRAREVRS